jgi:hypothetical protein
MNVAEIGSNHWKQSIITHFLVEIMKGPGNWRLVFVLSSNVPYGEKDMNETATYEKFNFCQKNYWMGKLTFSNVNACQFTFEFACQLPHLACHFSQIHKQKYLKSQRPCKVPF